MSILYLTSSFRRLVVKIFNKGNTGTSTPIPETLLSMALISLIGELIFTILNEITVTLKNSSF